MGERALPDPHLSYTSMVHASVSTKRQTRPRIPWKVLVSYKTKAFHGNIITTSILIVPKPVGATKGTFAGRARVCKLLHTS